MPAVNCPTVVSVVGLKKAGKTSVVEAVLRGLRGRGFRAGAVKSMVHSAVTLDVEGKDTFRHRRAGAQFVFVLSRDETAIMWDTPGRMTLKDILGGIPAPVDFLVCEGLEDPDMGDDVLVVMAAWSADGIQETWKVRGISGRLVAYSGRFGAVADSHGGLPVFNVLDEAGAGALVELILKERGR